MGSTIDGLVSGLNTTQIIASLMQVERMPEQQLVNQQSATQSLMSVLQTLNLKVGNLGTAAGSLVPDAITGQSAWTATSAVSSDTTRATATAGSMALSGALSFTVTSLATAGSAVSTGSVSATTAAVASGPVLLAQGVVALGFSGFEPGATLAAGKHAVEVTQASAGARLNGATPMAAGTTIAAGGSTLSLFVDGSATATNFTLAAGTYTRDQLAAEVTRATGGVVTGSVNSDGTLRLTGTHEGSVASLKLAGANTDLGLSDTTTVATGTAAIVKLDGNINTIADVTPGGSITLSAANGDSIVAKAAGGLRVGTAAAAQVGVAAGATLDALVTAVNGGNFGMTAAAVQTSPGNYRFQLSSTTTGVASQITVGGSALTGLGAMAELSAGTDTVLHVGSGAGAYDVRSSTTAVKDLLPGVTINATKVDPTTPVTVTVRRDDAAIANQVSGLVDQANSILGYITSNDNYNATTKSGGPLLGNSLAHDLARRLSDAVVGTSASSPGMVGVSLVKDGTMSFDRAKFLAAYAKDPVGTQATITNLATAMASISKQASDPTKGQITTQIKSQQDSIKDLTQRIAAFEDRMTLKQQSLQTQYSNLETMLGKLKSQSSWLTGQLATLPTQQTLNGK
ncbi:MAG: Flagellar hook-associated protein 2 [Frankiales bacterium]|jgi:flagellar hook-associated protein 2|nr:Flagellar hook-associated protein 2 [Frankiales bacterium]